MVYGSMEQTRLSGKRKAMWKRVRASICGRIEGSGRVVVRDGALPCAQAVSKARMVHAFDTDGGATPLALIPTAASAATLR
eukprot:COSAG01_NODE_5025_length_4539_cov_18.108559_6_plen_81_part_00